MDTESLVWNLYVVGDNARIDTVLGGKCAERIFDTASAPMAFTEFGRAKTGHSLSGGGRAGKRPEYRFFQVHGAPLR